MIYRSLFALTLLAACAQQPAPQAADQQPQPHRAQVGEASYYGPEFNGRRTASGERFDPQSNTAASPNLPLGTTARVTNLENGRSTTVEVKDRGPHARGRIVDLSPATASQLGMRQQGTAPVKVEPLHVPQQEAER
jgi:rare lipoprotein A